MSAVDLIRHFPYQDITGNAIQNSKGEISIGIKVLKSPEIYSIATKQANQISQAYTQILNLLPPNAKLHRQDFYYKTEYTNQYDGDNFIIEANNKYYCKKEIQEHYCNFYITLSPHEHIKKSPFVVQYVSPGDWLFKKPFKTSEKTVDDLEIMGENFINSLNSIEGFSAKRMNNTELRCSITDYFNQSYATPNDKDENLSIDPIEYINGEMRIGNQWIKVLTLIREGDSVHAIKDYQSSPKEIYDHRIDFNNKITSGKSNVFPIGMGLLFDHVLNVTIEVFDNNDIISYINQIAHSHNIGRIIPRFKKDVIFLQKECSDFIDEVTERNLKVCLTSINIILKDTSLKKLARKTELAKAAFQKMDGAMCWVENQDVGNIFWASAPGNSSQNYRTFISTTWQSANYLQKETIQQGDSEGFIFCERHSGKPVSVDLLSKKYIDYHHTGIFAPTRSGKTFFAQSFSNQFLAMGNHQIIIDKGESYRRLCKVHNGKYYDAKTIMQIGFNIFDCEKDENGNYLYYDAKEGSEEIQPIDFVMLSILILWKGDDPVTKDEKTIIREMVQEYYDYGNKKKETLSLTEFFNRIDAFKASHTNDEKVYQDFAYDSLKLQLKEYAIGAKKGMLNAEKGFDILNDRLVIFEVGGISEEDMEIVNLQIANLALRKFARLPRGIRKNLTIDECIDFLVGQMGDKIGGFFAKTGKYGGLITVIFQSVSYLKGAAEQVMNKILSNMGIKIVLGIQGEKREIDQAIEMLSLTSEDVELIKTMQREKAYRDFFIKVGEYPFVLRHEVSPVAAAIFTTDSTELDELNTLEKTFNGDIKVAARQYVINKKA